jgi:hypothetical protein
MNSIDQRNKNLDEREVALSPINQEQSEKKKNSNLGIVKEKEEQEEVSPSEREEGGGLQAETSKNQRGKYRQYEDSQVIVEKIRSYRTQRYPDSEIMKLLDNMPRRTYYNFVKKLQEQDLQIMKQWMRENVEHVSEELMIYRETLCQKLREIQSIIDNKNTSAKDRMDAIKQQLEISEKLARFTERNRFDSMKNAELVF